MNYNDAKELLKKINIDIDKEEFEQFLLYKELLLEWNQKINLTSITDENEIWLKHFVDSCTIEKYVNKNSKIIDVGTGAGFPTIPLKIVRKDINLTLLDSLNKRINFLKEVVDKLNLDKVDFIHSRSEDAGQDKLMREKYDVVTARAVANLATLSEYCIPFIKLNGIFICMKAGNVTEEINNGKNAIEILGGKIETVNTFFLPNSDIERTIIIIRKVKSTPNIYPRKAGIPAKNPL